MYWSVRVIAVAEGGSVVVVVVCGGIADTHTPRTYIHTYILSSPLNTNFFLFSSSTLYKTQTLFTPSLKPFVAYTLGIILSVYIYN